MLWQTLKLLGKIFPLALSTAGLICLAIVFAGCTSPSSPSNLYFMKVNYIPVLTNSHKNMASNSYQVKRIQLFSNSTPAIGQFEEKNTFGLYRIVSA